MTQKLPQPFPESLKDSTGGNQPDFPGSSGDRERGKFRPSATPRLTAVAVTDDRGKPIAEGLTRVLNEMLTYQRAMLLALSLISQSESFTDEEVLNEVR